MQQFKVTNLIGDLAREVYEFNLYGFAITLSRYAYEERASTRHKFNVVNAYNRSRYNGQFNNLTFAQVPLTPQVWAQAQAKLNQLLTFQTDGEK